MFSWCNFNKERNLPSDFHTNFPKFPAFSNMAGQFSLAIIQDCIAYVLQKQPPEVFQIKKDVLKNFAKFTGKYLCQSHFFSKLQACNFIKKEILAQVFSCEFCEMFKNTFFTEHLRTTVSVPREFSFFCSETKLLAFNILHKLW